MTNTRRTWSSLLGLFLLASFGWVGGLSAQGTTTAAISGFVRTSDGTPVVTAEVVVRNANTGVTNRTITNEDGRYFIPYLNPGSGYAVEVTALGYRTERIEVRVREVLAELVHVQSAPARRVFLPFGTAPAARPASRTSPATSCTTCSRRA